ncbi:MAG: LamG-like jellyroll fold domain-containing protein, partial [Luteolibacter sp.]
GGNWQRVFDFGSEIEKYMMLTVKDGAGKLNFTMTTSRGTDGTLTLVGPAMPTATWTHVAVTLNGGTATMYVNGLPAASATADRVAPLFGQPFCYLGRSMWNSDPLFSGRIDDFRIHNYALSGSDIYTLWGQSANSPPVFASDPINKPSATEDASYTAQTLAGDASDANGGTLTFSKVSGPAWLAVAASGALSGTPANSDVGVNAFVVRVTDPSGATDDANLYITVANTNDAPVWTSTSITKPTVTRDQPYTGSTLAGLATDVDGGATLTFSKTNGPTWLTVSTDGTLSGTPAVGDVGANTFTVRVTDNAGATADATLFITVLAFELRSQYQFESNTNDSTGNFPGSATGSPVYATGRIGQGIVFDGIDDNVTLPADIVNHRDLTLAAYVYWNGGGNWQRLFDFGNSQTSYLMLTPNTGSGMRFTITNGGVEQQLNTTVLPIGQWVHIAVTLNGDTGTLYINGTAVATNTGLTLNPDDLKPALNYIGKSQFADPLFNGKIDDFRIYNYALGAVEIADMANPIPEIPNGLTAAGRNHRIDLTWKVSQAADTYTVKRSTVSGGPYTTIASGLTTTSFSNTGLTNGTPYYYVISATNEKGECANSAEIGASPSDLLVRLKFDETSGTTAADSSGNGYPGTAVNSPTWISGQFNNAINLANTSSQCVTMPSGVVTGVDDFTISTWVKMTSLGNWARLFDLGTGTTNYMFLAPQGPTANRIRFAIRTPSVNEQIINSTVNTPVGTWFHVAVTLAGTTGRLYINGVEAGSNTGMTLKPSSLGPTNLNYLGKSQFADPYLNGALDDFRIYGRAFSAAEITSLSTVLPAPTGLAATAGSGQVSLTWNTVSGASGYSVKRATTSGGPYTTVQTDVTGTTFTNTGLTNATVYYYVVSATNLGGESPNSGEASATPLAPPGIPTGLAATAGDSTVFLEWTASNGTDSYKVKRATSPGGPYTTIATGLTTTSRTDSTVSNGTVYYYVVSSVNTVAESDNSAEVSAIPLPPVPSQPTTLTATPGNATVSLAWSAAAGTNRYSVKRATNSGGPYTTIAGSLTTTAYSDTDVSNNTTYYYVVSAANLGGESEPSPEASATPVAPPITPAGLAATAGDASASLVWNSTAGASGYRVKRSTTNGGPYSIVAGNITSTTYSDTGLTNGTVYYYVVSAYNAGGDSADSSQVTAAPQAVPVAPTGLAATVVSSSKISLTWNTVTTASSYTVKRATSSGGPYTTVASGLTSTNLQDTALTSITTYYYVVSALSNGGESPVSAEASATTTDLRVRLAFDETTGTTAGDSSGDGYDANLVNGPLFSTGTVGNAVDLDGTNDHVTLPSAAINNLTTFTASVWVKPDTVSTWARVFDFGTGATANMFLTPKNGANGKVRFAITTSGGAGEQRIDGLNPLPAGTWSHVVITLSGNTGILYVNGSEVGRNTSMTLNPASLGTTTQNYIGRSQYPDPYFDGRVDDFRLYTRALGASEITAMTQAQMPLATVTGLQASAVSSGQINLTWTAGADATSYNVKRASTPGGPYTTVATGLTSSAYSNTGLTSGTTYYYVVSGSNAGGEGSNSTEASAATIPDAPASLTASTVSSARIDLAWGASTGATSYQVKRSATSGGPYTTLATGLSSTSYSDTGLDAGATWYYVVSASNSGTSADSTQASATTLADTPTDLVATVVSSSDINITWTASAGASSYDVKRSTSVSGPFVSISTGLTTSNFSDVGLNAATTYYYVVSAVNAAGASPNSAPANATTLPLPPAAPSGLTATAGNAQVSLTWSSVSGATSYSVKRSTISGGPYTNVASGVTAISYTDTGLSNGTTYFYVVSGSNTGGEGSNSTEASATTIPAAPATLTAATVSSVRIDLAWSASAGATTYQVKRSATNGGPYTTLATGLSSTSYSDTGLTAGATWYYVVSASNTGTSTDSTQASATTLAATPTGLAATAVSSSGINLTWTASAGAASYEVKRATSASGPFVSITTGLTISNFSDVGLTAATTYYYVVSAVNAGGSSPNSTSANATTLPVAPVAPSGLTATAGNTQVSLAWSSVSGAASYNVKRATVSGGPYTTVASSVTTTSYTNTGLTNGTTYYYVVNAVNTGGTSADSSQATATPTGLPSPWVTLDVGAVAAAGTANHNAGVYTIEGSGADIAGSADELRYVYQAASGDCNIIARVTSIENTSSTAKAGIVIRESTATGSRYAGVFLTPGGQARFQRRTSTDGSTTTNSTNSITVPRYIRLTRTGNNFDASYSSNGTTWIQFGGTRSITMSTAVTIGLGVSSNADGTLCTAVFDNVTATP